MGDEAREFAPVEWSPTSAQSWPILAPDRYEAQFVSSYKPPRHAVPGTMSISYNMNRIAVVGVLLLVAAGCFVNLWVAQGPRSLSPLLLIVPTAVVGVALITAWLVEMSRTRRKFINPAGSAVAPYAFAITPTTIEFPATMYQKAASWDRRTTTAKLDGHRAPGLVLCCTGKHPRRYDASRLADAPEDLVARISGHRPKSGPRMR
jgi:hypothetical protein